MAILIGSDVSRLNVKTCCGLPSSSTVTSSRRTSLMMWLLRSTAVNSRSTNSVPRRTVSSLVGTSSCCRVASGLGFCGPGESERTGGLCEGFDFCQASAGTRRARTKTTTVADSREARARLVMHITLLIRQIAIPSRELNLDLPRLLAPILVRRLVVEDVLLTKILLDSGEGAKQLQLLRRQEYLPSRLLAKESEFLIVRVF